MLENMFYDNVRSNDKNIGVLESKIEVAEIMNQNLTLEIGCLQLNLQELDNLRNNFKLLANENNSLKLKTLQPEKTYATNENNMRLMKRKGAEDYEQNLLMRNPNFLSKNQLKLLTGVKHQITWSSEDLAKGYALRMKGKGVYDFLSKEIGYPLPSQATLYRHAKKLKLSAGKY